MGGAENRSTSLRWSARETDDTKSARDDISATLRERSIPCGVIFFAALVGAQMPAEEFRQTYALSLTDKFPPLPKGRPFPRIHLEDVVLSKRGKYAFRL